MKQAEYCVDAQINHIQFKHDVYYIGVYQIKKSQKNKKYVGPWHLYTNTLKQYVWPVLALLQYLLCYAEVFKGGVPLFEGSQQYNNCSNIFRCVNESYKYQLKALGFEVGDLVSHSCCKGVATMIASGWSVSPPIVSLCIRAG